jgi:hypothetical protein
MLHWKRGTGGRLYMWGPRVLRVVGIKIQGANLSCCRIGTSQRVWFCLWVRQQGSLSRHPSLALLMEKWRNNSLFAIEKVIKMIPNWPMRMTLKWLNCVPYCVATYFMHSLTDHCAKWCHILCSSTNTSGQMIGPSIFNHPSQ